MVVEIVKMWRFEYRSNGVRLQHRMEGSSSTSSPMVDKKSASVFDGALN